ncbi:MAG: hypothetical protein IPJ00_10150 [Saprospirales bacterium]|nr:hypothetical protein [Saprospirales bacterium]
MIEVWATDLDAGSFDNCGDVILSFSPDVNDINVIYTCDDLGQNAVQLWVTDIYGNQDYCETFIVVQDNLNFCSGVPVVIAGEVSTEDAEAVEGVTVEMNGGLLTGSNRPGWPVRLQCDSRQRLHGDPDAGRRCG